MCSFMSAQEGIYFRNCTWNEAVELAKSENKPIFIDFYTQWCGPCYNMAKNIFVLHSVGSFYNDKFICLKMDAENGEGIGLAKKYGVRSYPTYLFVDPKDQSEIHRSSGRQDAGTFIFTGKSALVPSLCSRYLEEEYTRGNRNAEFLLDYAMYKGSIYDKKAVDAVCNILLETNDCQLDDKHCLLENEKIWNLFVKYINGLDTPFFKMMVSNKIILEQLYGKDAVAAKFYGETQYSKDKGAVIALPEFEGKDVVLMYMDYDRAILDKDYRTAAVAADKLMAYQGPLYEEVCKYLYYIGRSNLYGEFPDVWHNKCLEICRYVAYNHPNRNDASIHQLYALQLEMWAKRIGKEFPSLQFGAKEYSMRPKDLKVKPKK